MKTDIENNRPLVVCLHGSASSSRQWAGLTEMLQDHVRVISPDLVGYTAASPFRKGQPFSMDDEVANIMRQIEKLTGKRNGPLHLVAHSYGGAVALQIALTYPERVASLSLYEPAQFRMLLADGPDSAEGDEIMAICQQVRSRLRIPFGKASAARVFIDYWSGKSTWQSLPAKRKKRFASLMPKVAAEFESILYAKVSAESVAGIAIPVRLMCGSKTRASATKTSEVLSRLLPNVDYVGVEGADHMAPTTRPNHLDPLFAEHVLSQLELDREVAA